jgi:beta-lactamase regulating signal transducer with metallopeptidase domain
MIRSLNHIADGWWQWQSTMFLQVSVLILLVFLVDLCIRRWAWPRLRHALWLLVLLKLLLPPSLTSPVSMVGHFWPREEPAPIAQIAEIAEEPEPPVADTPASAVALPAEPTAPTATQTATVVLAPTAPSRPRLSWKVWPTLVWAAGVIALLTWLVLRLRRFRRDLALAVSDQPAPEWVDRVLHKAASQLKLRRVPRVQISHATTSPAVFGLFRPVVLLPASETHTLSEAEGRHILLHELAHVKRGDLVLHALHIALLILYWFNPLLWVVRRFLQNLRELCCDATVANALRQDVPAYRETLLNTARRLLAQTPPTSLGLLGWFENSHWLGIRLRWLERNTWKRRWLQISATLALVLTIAGCVLPMGRREPLWGESWWRRHCRNVTPAAMQVLRVYEAHRDQAPSTYAMAMKTEHGVHIAYREGARWHAAYYPFGEVEEAYRLVSDTVPADRVQAGETLESMLRWTANRIPQDMRACDGENVQSWMIDGFGGMTKHSPHSAWTGHGPGPSVMASTLLRSLGWPQLVPSSGMPLDVVTDDSYARDNGLVCLESRYSSSAFSDAPTTTGRPPSIRYYLNPQKSYVCQRLLNVDGRASDVTQFSQNGATSFTPSELQLTENTRNYWVAMFRGEAGRILLDTDPSFPEGIFDLDALGRKYVPGYPLPAKPTGNKAILGWRSLVELKGTVLAGDTGEPIENALVCITAPPENARVGGDKSAPQRTATETRSGPDGRFALRIPFGEQQRAYPMFSVDARAPGFRSVSAHPQPLLYSRLFHVSTHAGQTWELTIPLHRAKYVAGVVTDGAGKPLPNVRVTAHMKGNGSGDPMSTTRTNAKGRFEVFSFPPSRSRPGERGELAFTYPDTTAFSISDIYQMDDESLASLAIKMQPGSATPNTRRADLRFGEPIQVNVACDSLKIATVTFTKRDGTAVATLSARYLSHPKATWKIRIALLDAGNNELAAAAETIENSGIVVGVPLAHEKQLALKFPLDKAERAKRLVLTVSPGETYSSSLYSPN